MEILIATVLGLAAVAANLTFLWYWKGVEKTESEAGRIPAHKLVGGNRKASVLYLEDYMFFRLGDRIALSVMDFAIAGTLWTRGLPSIQAIIACIAIGCVITLASHMFWLHIRKNEPDSGYSSKGVSKVGLVHLPYYGAQWIAGLIGLAVIYNMARGGIPWSPLAIVGIAAAVVYFLALGLDCIQKRY